MPSLASLISTIIHSPQLPEIARVIRQKLEDEGRSRSQFYENMTPETKVEFITGEVVLHSPARNVHLDVTKWILKLIDTYVGVHLLGEVKSEKCLVVFPRNDYEPDIVYFTPDKAKSLKADTMKFPIPDLVVGSVERVHRTAGQGCKVRGFRGAWRSGILDRGCRSTDC